MHIFSFVTENSHSLINGEEENDRSPLIIVTLAGSVYDGLLLYRDTYLLLGHGKYTKLTSEIFSTLVAL